MDSDDHLKMSRATLARYAVVVGLVNCITVSLIRPNEHMWLWIGGACLLVAIGLGWIERRMRDRE